MPASRERERRGEEDIMAAQERAANEERSRRARETLETLRQADIQAARAAAGLCVQCGGRLGAIARVLGMKRHLGCKSFVG